MTNCIDTILFGQVCDSCDGGAIFKIIAYIIQFLTYGVAALGVLGLVIAGIVYMTSNGDPSRMTKALSRIKQVVIGLLSYGLLFAFLEFLIPGGIVGTTLDSETSSCPVHTVATPTNDDCNSETPLTDYTPGNTIRGGSSNAHGNLGYVLHIPENATTNMPLVVFMHGAGESHEYYTLERFSNLKIVKALNDPVSIPKSDEFIAIAPQLPDHNTYTNSTDLAAVKSIIDETVNAYQIDTSRIYLLGYSMGGAMSICLINNNPGFFRAAMILGMDDRNGCNTPSNFTDTRMKFIVASRENKEARVSNFVDRVNGAGGNASYQVIQDADHEDLIKGTKLDFGTMFNWLVSDAAPECIATEVDESEDAEGEAIPGLTKEYSALGKTWIIADTGGGSDVKDWGYGLKGYSLEKFLSMGPAKQSASAQNCNVVAGAYASALYMAKNFPRGNNAFANTCYGQVNLSDNMFQSSSLETVLQKIYSEINAGRPVVALVVNSATLNTGGRHFLVIVGYEKTVGSASRLTEDKLLMLNTGANLVTPQPTDTPAEGESARGKFRLCRAKASGGCNDNDESAQYRLQILPSKNCCSLSNGKTAYGDSKNACLSSSKHLGDGY